MSHDSDELSAATAALLLQSHVESAVQGTCALMRADGPRWSQIFNDHLDAIQVLVRRLRLLHDSRQMTLSMADMASMDVKK